jgi:hypothetical protein
MTGSFAIPGRGPGYWRGTFARHEVTVVPGSWDVTDMRWTGSFDWTVEDCLFRSAGSWFMSARRWTTSGHTGRVLA